MAGDSPGVEQGRDGPKRSSPPRFFPKPESDATERANHFVALLERRLDRSTGG